jgi:Class II flagellar assembly regulator
MKIESGRPIAPSSSARRSAGAAAPGFAPALDGPGKPAPASAASAVPSMDAILALQGESVETERRKRQMRRGKAALDALETLERGLALGRAPGGLRAELEVLRRGAERTGEAGLDALMLEIDTRVAVELAKLERV